MRYHFLRNKSIRLKLILMNFFIIIMPLTILGMISYQQISLLFEKKINDYSNQIVMQINNKIGYYIDEMNKTSFLINASEDINSVLYADDSSHPAMKELNRYTRVSQYLSNLRLFQSFNFNIYFYCSQINEDFSTNSFDIVNIQQIKEFEWFKNLEKSGARNAVILIDSINSKSYVYLARNIYNPETKSFMGTVVLEAPVSLIENDIKEVNLGPDAAILICNNFNEVIFSMPRERKVDFSNLAEDLAVKDQFTVKINREKNLVSSHISKVTSWKVIGVIPVRPLLGELDAIKAITFFTGFLCFAVALLISILLSRSISKPIEKLRNLMKIAENGELSVQFDEIRNDEIGQLGKGFNKMLYKIKELINKVYEVQLKEREAELNALQSQINPHFLYNTLESISMTALLNNDMDAVNMLNILVKFFRYNISRGREIVPISKEIEHINNYIEIQKFRFRDKFVIKMDISEEIYACSIIKLSLQPLVENSIHHGLERKKGSGVVRIEGVKANGNVIMRISDNGIGIDEDTLIKIRRDLKNSKVGNGYSSLSIGLKNVHKRIQLYFGEQYGLKVDSELGKGTEITLTLPSMNI